MAPDNGDGGDSSEDGGFKIWSNQQCQWFTLRKILDMITVQIGEAAEIILASAVKFDQSMMNSL